jgi:hypothetical protein
MRFEPGDAPQFASRAFVADLRRYLFIYDLHAGTFTTYINFEEVFAKFVNGSSLGAGFGSFAFHPEYAQNGKFYSVHTEGVMLPGSMVPSNEFLPGLDLSGGYMPTPSIDPPDGDVSRHAVLLEWTDTDLTNTTFEGSLREVLRVGFTNGNHAIADLGFNPVAQSGDSDFANLYVALGDGGAGQKDAQDNSIPQRLDALPGKILRITPDLDRRPADLLASNGRYRVPSTGADPNPFVHLDLADVKPEIFAYGFRNPQRMSWDRVSNTLIVADIGLYSWEELNLVRKGANYGYSEREGPEQLFIGGPNDGKTGSQTTPPSPHPQPDVLTVTGLLEASPPRYPSAVYSHRDGDAIAGGFVYRGTLLPHLYGKYVFGDITTARVFYVDMNELIAADDNDPTTLAAVRELQILFDPPDDNPDRGAVPMRLFDIIADEYARRGGTTGDDARLPQAGGHMSDSVDAHGVPYGGGRADIRFAEDRQGELYILSKSDGMIRKLAATRTGTTSTTLTSSPNPSAVGATIELRASVTAAYPAVGSIEFVNGATRLGTTPLTDGEATFTLANLAAGTHSLTARFVPSDAQLLESVGGVTHFAGQPDLVSSIGVLPATATPGSRLTFTETTANIGPIHAGSTTTQYVLSNDMVRGDDLSIGSRKVAALDPAGESVVTLALTIPMSAPLGSYYVIACTDTADTVGESEEANNCTASDTPVDVTRPDLVITSVATASPSVAPGGSFIVSDTARNQGGIVSTSTTTRFYLSIDHFKSADDRLLSGTRSVPGLAPGASSSKSGTKLTVPSTVPLGHYQLIACADDTAKNTEISEANNCTAAASRVQVGRPDLIVGHVPTVPSEIAPGKTFSTSAATTNQGTASAAPSTVRFYFSTDETKDGSDTLLAGSISVKSLTGGQTATSSKTLSVPAVTPDGSYRLLACADDTLTVSELDETNNCRASAAVVVVKRADLTQTTLSNPPATLLAGANFSVTDTVINIGSIASGSTTTRYYLSQDPVKSADDVLLIGGRSVSSLGPGGVSTGTRVVAVPAVPAGTYHVIACADAAANAVESREDNNCVASASSAVVP